MNATRDFPYRCTQSGEHTNCNRENAAEREEEERITTNTKNKATKERIENMLPTKCFALSQHTVKRRKSVRR